jgi:hypothetical protein
MTAPGAADDDQVAVDALVADRYLDVLLGIADPHLPPAPGHGPAPGHKQAPGHRPASADDPLPGVPAPRDAADAGVEPELREAARVLRRAFVRVHPSFRFEERLAGRLSAAARADGGAGARGALIPFGKAMFRVPAGASGQATSEVVEPPEVARPDPWLQSILAGSPHPTGSPDRAGPLDAAGEPEPTSSTDSRLAGARRPLLVGGAITSAALSLAGVAWVAWRVARPAAIGEIEGTV